MTEQIKVDKTIMFKVKPTMPFFTCLETTPKTHVESETAFLTRDELLALRVWASRFLYEIDIMLEANPEEKQT